MFAVNRRTLMGLWCAAAMMVSATTHLPAGDGALSSPRRTELVKLIEMCAPAAVNLMGYVPIPNHPGSFTLSLGSGSILHEAGFILTNDHVANTEGQQIVVLQDGRQYPYTVVAASEQEDLAVIRVHPDRPLTAITLGRSDDLMLGEPVVVIGNPGGLMHTVSIGIITGTDRVGGNGTQALTGMIQTDANINGGNSGGPLINALGQQIGVVESKKTGVEGLGFAIQIDRFRKALPAMLAAERRYGFRLGMTVDTLGEAKVTGVEPDSPAEAAGVQVGDVVTKVADMTITDGVHFYLALVDRQGGQALPMVLQRGPETVTVAPALQTVPPRPAVKAKGLTQGVMLQAYLGQWRLLPDFNELEPISWGVVPSFGLFVQGKVSDYFGLKFTGFVEVPADGLYTFSTRSDDGTKLYIGDDLVVDNDGLHGAIGAAGLIRLAKGLHPITVTFFEHAGEQSLEVFYEGPEIAKRAIPPEALFCKPPGKP